MVLSIDASTTHIGWAIFDEDDLIDYGRLLPQNPKGEWRERIQDFSIQMLKLILKYRPKHIVMEDVPLIKKQMITLVQLGAVQGMILTLASANHIDIEFIAVSTWRKNIGLFDGSQDGKKRDEMKIKSINKANEIFNINLPLVYTKFGNYDERKSNDDTADAINLYASTRDKYRVQIKTFGRR